MFPRLVREVGAARQPAADDDHQRRVVRIFVGAVSAFSAGSMRAIEQGRYLARAANTGISGFVDPYGRVMQQTEIFEREIVAGDVRMLEARRSMAESGICSRIFARRLTLAALRLRRRHSWLSLSMN